MCSRPGVDLSQTESGALQSYKEDDIVLQYFILVIWIYLAFKQRNQIEPEYLMPKLNLDFKYKKLKIIELPLLVI